MRPLGVIEHEEPVQRPLQGPRRTKVVPAELDTPVLMKHRPLQAFDEPVGPRMSWFRARMPHLAVGTGRDEAGLELLAVVRQHSLQPPAGRTTSVRKAAILAAVTSPTTIRAQPNDEAQSQAVSCQTLPTPFSFPM